MAEQTAPDARFRDEGSLVLVWLDSESAQDWWEANVDGGELDGFAWEWCGGKAIPPRSAGSVLWGMCADGLRVVETG